MNAWQTCPISRRADGSYVITHNGYPYHVVNDEEMASSWAEINAYAREHPDQVTDEPAPPEPTEAELLEIAKASKLAELNRVMDDTDKKLVRSTSDLVSALLAPDALTVHLTGAKATNSEQLQQSMCIFARLRSVQEWNRQLRTSVEIARTVEDVQAIEPVLASSKIAEFMAKE